MRSKYLLFFIVIIAISCNNTKDNIPSKAKVENFDFSKVSSGSFYLDAVNSMKNRKILSVINSVHVTYDSKQNYTSNKFVIIFEKGFYKDDFIRVYVDNSLYVISNIINDEILGYLPVPIINIPDSVNVIGFQISKNPICYISRSDLSKVVVISINNNCAYFRFKTKIRAGA